MGEVVRFIPKSERERGRLIREARAIYDSIFPSSDSIGDQQDKAPQRHAIIGASAYGRDGILLL